MTLPTEPTLRVIYNPHSGMKSGISTNAFAEDDLRMLMNRHGIGNEIVVTNTKDEATLVARDAVSRNYDAVIAVGGDGTAGVIARELIGTRTALGIIPSGSIMNIGRMLGIPREPEAAVAIIADGHVATVDVGEVRGHIFFEAASVGLNAPVFQAAQRFDAGQRRSVLEAIWIAMRYRPARMTIKFDDSTVVTRALIVTVANCAYTGIGFTVAPLARLDDGMFDVSVFRRFSRTGLLLHFARIAFGRRNYSPKVSTYRSSRVQVDSVRPLPCRADSHDLGTTPVTFTCLPGRLRVITPKRVLQQLN
jgi:diacylglycerol kinase (ATP)